MRGCTCTGMTLCPQCQTVFALAEQMGMAVTVLPLPQAPPVLSEKAFQAAVIRLATQHDWKVFHPFDSRKCAPGYPDLTMAKPGEPVIFAELKVPGEKPTIEQTAWLATLRAAMNTDVYLWYPDDWPVIYARLTQESPHGA